MNTAIKMTTVALTSLLLSAPIAFAQTNGNGTTLAGGDNGKAAKMDETSKTGMMKTDKSGAMMKSDGMKSGSMSKDGSMPKDGPKSDGKM